MGAIWLGSLPDVLRNAGLKVAVYPGWETRSRSSGGYDSLLAIQVHHTASSGANPLNEMRYMWDNASAKPIGACYLAPDGTWTVGAAGATNTSGRGGPLHTSRGIIALNAANRHVLAIEAANRGDGTPWPIPQQDSYVKGCAALNRAYFGGVLQEVGDIHAHFEWTSRKVDPAGQSYYAVGGNKWNMHDFRRDVAYTLNPPPATLPPASGDDMEYLDSPVRMFDSRQWPGAKMEAGREYKFAVPANIPAKSAVMVTVTAVDPSAGGYLTLWSGKGIRPTASNLNWSQHTGAIANTTAVKVSGGEFKVFCSAATHLVVDINGYQ